MSHAFPRLPWFLLQDIVVSIKKKLPKILDKKKIGYDIKHERQKRNLSRLWDSSVPKTTKSRRRDERKT